MSKQLPLYVGLAALFIVSFLLLNWTYGYVLAFQSLTNDCFFMFGRSFLLEFFRERRKDGTQALSSDSAPPSARSGEVPKWS